MPLQRSPVKSPEKLGTKNILPQSSSTPDLTGNQSDYVTQRPLKRKQGDDLDFFMKRMEDMFNGWAAENDKKNQSLFETVKTIKEQNEEIVASINFISAKYDELLTKIETLEKDKKTDRLHIQALEQKIDNLEKLGRSTCLEIRNIPCRESEKSEDLCAVLKNLGGFLDIPLTSSDIKNIYRGPSKVHSKKPIIVDFVTMATKDKVLTSYKTFNRKNRNNNIYLSHLGIEGSSSKVFISEYLTPRMKNLYYNARMYASANNYDFCWASAGAVYLRKKEGDPVIRLKNEEDLKKLQEKV